MKEEVWTGGRAPLVGPFGGRAWRPESGSPHRGSLTARNKRAYSSWNMDAILEGRRSGFARRGPKERLSKEMILKAQEGNYDWIYGILRDNLASPDVADAKGYTVLAAAAVSTPPAGSCTGPHTWRALGDGPS